MGGALQTAMGPLRARHLAGLPRTWTIGRSARLALSTDDVAMPTTTTLCSFVLGSSLAFLAACDPADREPFAPAEALRLRSGTDAGGGGIWINNGLDDPDVSGIDPDAALASEQGLATDRGLLLDPERLDTVRYLVECALPEGRVLVKEVRGERLELAGAIGLAPEWEDDACDEDCQEWVSACLLARTNVGAQPVDVWMRAEHPAIGEGTHPQFPFYEASFFGNLFADEPSQNLCIGTVVGPLLGQLQGRTCAGVLGGSCGFVTYTQCELQQRCTFSSLGLLGTDVVDSPKHCIAGSLLDGHAYHTISTYVGPA